jgi:hypothetical protein
MDIKKIGIIAIVAALVYYVYNYITTSEATKALNKKCTAAFKHYRGTYRWLLNIHAKPRAQWTEWVKKIENNATIKGVDFNTQAANAMQYLCDKNPDYGSDCEIRDALLESSGKSAVDIDAIMKKHFEENKYML